MHSRQLCFLLAFPQASLSCVALQRDSLHPCHLPALEGWLTWEPTRQKGSTHSTSCTFKRTADFQAAAHILDPSATAWPHDQASKLHVRFAWNSQTLPDTSPHLFPTLTTESRSWPATTRVTHSDTRKVLTSASRGQTPWNCVLFRLLMPETAL